MKKSLIALAVLAASGATFAQVTITGEYGFGYQKSSAGVRGLLSTDGAVSFNASEDLGGGMKADAQVKIAGGGRNSTISSSEDAFVKLTTGAGLFTFGAIESGNSSFNTAGAPLSLPDGLDGRIVDGGTNVDTVSWAAKFGAIGVSLGYYDSGTAPGAGDGVVEGYGLGLSYADGPLALSLAVKNPTARSADKGVRVRLGGSFDAGAVKFGLGAQTQTEGNPTQMNVGISAPVGALTVGALYARSEAKTGGLGAVHNARSGFGIGVDYALGKMTKVNLSYGNTDDGSGTGNLDQFRLKMFKSF